MIIEEEVHLAHYGILRKSGRYPWGSGGDQNAINKGFLDYVSEMKKQGLSEAEIAKGLSDEDETVSVAQLRAAGTIARAEQRQANIVRAQRMHDKGVSNVAIGQRMGIPESSVRNLLAPGAADKADAIQNTSEMLRRQVAEKKFIYVGSGVENQLGMSKERLNVAVHVLREEGYEVHVIKIPQATTNKETSVKVLAPPGTTWADVRTNSADIKQIVGRTLDGGHTWSKIHDAMPIDPKRVDVVYKEDGGDKADGVIYVRPGVDDVSIGSASYAQVRIQVGSGHYLKGMAMYKDDLPKGVDLSFNTNKSSTGNKLDSMKKLEDDKEFPFGAVINRQVLENEGSKDPKKPERVTSVMNIIRQEGEWGTWTRGFSSQFLSKQEPSLAKQQLSVTSENRRKELDDIMALSNPTVKKKLLLDFAEGADASAVNLRAAAINAERTPYHIILPITSMSETEVYAPNFRPGEKVVLVRYPHGGRFELPELTVNNRQPEARRLLGDAQDAVGINPAVAERMSGADFDGDFVLVIPNNHKKIKSALPLPGLKGFDPMSYKYPADVPHKPMSTKTKGREMGEVSNLITDMTLKGASNDQIVRAIRHSMVVIDAEKHDLNYKLSAQDNGIASLKVEFQDTSGRKKGGASTIISRAKSEIRIPDRRARYSKEGGKIDPVTGELKWMPTNKTRPGPNGTTVPRTIKTTKLAETTDAYSLVSEPSGTVMERIYADHSNEMKGLANKARLEHLNTPSLKYSPSANKAYAKEVASLTTKLGVAKENRPREVQAQIIANANIKARFASNPDLDSSQKTKIKNQAITVARNRVGAHKKDNQVEITQAEWNAIQAGAISNHKLEEILTNTDIDAIRAFATPHYQSVMSSNKTSTARQMLALGYTRAEIADRLGVGLTTLNTALKEGDE